jgi:hypothetical protein
VHTHEGSRTAETVQGYLRDLATVLTARGLTVRVHERAGILVARNDAVQGDDPLGRTMNPGLTQIVALSNDSGTLAWYWQWSGPTRDAPPEYELLGPADAIAEAGERVARVLAVATV